MVAAVIVVADEVADLGFEVSRQIVVLQKDAVLERRDCQDNCTRF